MYNLQSNVASADLAASSGVLRLKSISVFFAITYPCAIYYKGKLKIEPHYSTLQILCLRVDKIFGKDYTMADLQKYFDLSS